MSQKKQRGRGRAPRKATAVLVANKEEQDASLEAQVAKLKLEYDEEAFLDAAIKLAAAENDAQWINGCDHGHGSRAIDEKVLDFIRAFNSAFHAAEESLVNATKVVSRRYATVWLDSAKMKAVVSYLVCKATENALRGAERGSAGYCAALAYFFEHHIAVGMNNTEEAIASLNSQKAFELHAADNNDRVLVSFLRKRIPCKCLDEKYNEMKTRPKLGICSNPECPLPGRKAERSKMFYCTQCSCAYYCSSECQTVDWPEHKEECNRCSCCNSCGKKIT